MKQLKLVEPLWIEWCSSGMRVQLRHMIRTKVKTSAHKLSPKIWKVTFFTLWVSDPTGCISTIKFMGSDTALLDMDFQKKDEKKYEDENRLFVCHQYIVQQLTCTCYILQVHIEIFMLYTTCLLWLFLKYMYTQHNICTTYYNAFNKCQNLHFPQF